jgi:TRAP-type C4-dicarboxylate transport system substrate-binding protein
MHWFTKLILGLVFSSWASAAMSQTPTYPKLKLRMAHFLTSNFPGPIIDQWFADEVKKRSGGNIEIQIFWAGALGRPTELLDLVGSGSVELAAANPGYYPNEMPLSSIFQGVPFVFDNNGQAVRVSKHLFETKASLQAELKRNRVQPLFWHSLDHYHPLCTKKLETMADFKGRRMRGFGEYLPRVWSSLGATPVNVLPAELYEALMRGTMDCAFWAYDSLHAGKLYEVGKFSSDVDFGAQVNYPIMASQIHWEKWPTAVKDLLKQVGNEATERDVKLVQEKVRAARDDMLKNQGVQEVVFKEKEKLRAAIPDMQQAWVKNMAAKGLEKEAQDLVDSIRAEKPKH